MPLFTRWRNMEVMRRRKGEREITVKCKSHGWRQRINADEAQGRSLPQWLNFFFGRVDPWLQTRFTCPMESDSLYFWTNHNSRELSELLRFSFGWGGRGFGCCILLIIRYSLVCTTAPPALRYSNVWGLSTFLDFSVSLSLHSLPIYAICYYLP